MSVAPTYIRQRFYRLQVTSIFHDEKARFCLWSWCVLCLNGLLALSCWAQSPEEKGLRIAQEMDRRDTGFQDTEASLEMILINAQGQTKTRSLSIQTKEVPASDDGDKILMVFSAPRDIDGTALLTHTHVGRANDQWLFLPALKRVKRISSANQSGSFVGSEFAYEDLTSPEVAKYTYRYLRDEACGDRQCFVIERIPVYQHSGYSRHVVWVDQETYRMQRADFYDRRQDLLKTLLPLHYRQFLNAYWRAMILEMQNHQTHKRTKLVFSEYRFRNGLTDRDFTQNALRRIR